mgnify:CR=1 FL=1
MKFSENGQTGTGSLDQKWVLFQVVEVVFGAKMEVVHGGGHLGGMVPLDLLSLQVNYTWIDTLQWLATSFIPLSMEKAIYLAPELFEEHICVWSVGQHCLTPVQ